MKNLTGKFPVIFIGTGIEEINFLKILFTQNSVTENSWENAGSILLKLT